MQRVEKIDDIAGVLVNGGGRRIGGLGAKSAQVRREHPPVVRRKRELRLPHAGIHWKGVQEHKRPARPITLGWGFEVSQPADSWHGQIVGDQLNIWPDTSTGAPRASQLRGGAI